MWRLPLLPVVLLACGGVATPSTSTRSVIDDVTVIDVERSLAIPRQSVVIEAGRITYVGSAEGAPVSGATRIDGRNRYVIPGLWDMHAHVPANDTLLQMYLDHGVTGVREMGTSVERLGARRSLIQRGAWSGPRVISSTLYLDAGQGYREAGYTLNPTTVAAATGAVDSVARLGADFVKVLGAESAAVYEAIVDAATARNLRVSGHWPLTVPLDFLARTPMASIEHIFRATTACMFEGADACSMASERLDSVSLRDIGRAFATAGIAVTPTLVNQRRRAFRGDSVFTADPRLERIPAAIVARWRSDTAWNVRWSEAVRAVFEREVAVLPELERAGVQLLAGTDGPAEYLYAGASLQDELVLMVEAGVSAGGALRSATWAPALVMGASDSLGTIAPGKVADLVLLSANPLLDIRNVRRIDGVMLGGTWVRPPTASAPLQPR
jgi:imidazolonepropionase-like amidohydrolase